MITLTIATIPPLILTAPTLVDVGAVAAGAGGLSPSLDLRLDPGRGELVARLDPPPLRVRATVVLDDGTTLTGTVQAVRLGADPSITLES
jgi:hypothetical protein